MNLFIYGFITGIIFGFLLQASRVVRYDKQLGALRLMDMTLVKFMLSAVIVGMAGIYLLKDLGIIELKIKPTILGGNILGGLIFGAGWALLGYCPGTQLGALGEGRWDAFCGILGMITGSAVFAEVYPFLKRTILAWGNLGEITLPQVTGLNHWLIIIFLIAVFISLFKYIEKKNL